MANEKFDNFINEYKGKIKLGSYVIELSGVKQLQYGSGVDDLGERQVTGKKLICGSPILPVAVLDNMDSHIQKVDVACYIRGTWKHHVVSRSTLTNKTKIVALSDDGVPVGSDNAGALAKYFNDVLSLSVDTIPYRHAKSVMGWVDGQFVPYDSDIAFDGEDQFKYLYKAIDRKGTLNEWVEFVSPLRANIDMRLTLAASFASPLVSMVGENSFIYHLWGGTGSAKTVALMVAMSAWGNPQMGNMVRTMNMTINSMLSTAAFLNNLPFAGDELQTIKSRWNNYDNLIMCVTEGIDRGRMEYDKVKMTKTWRCSFLFTGEEPCTKVESGGGAKNRVIELECSKPLVENGNLTANFVKSHYGCAGQPYIESLKNFDVNFIFQDLNAKLMRTGKVALKQAGAMALMLTADFIANHTIFAESNMDDLEIEDVLPYCKSESDVDVSERAYQFICGVIAENANNFGDDSRVCWGFMERSTDSVFMIKTVLNRLLNENSFDFDSVKRKWVHKGYMMKLKGSAYTQVKRINGMSVRCVEIKLP